MQNSEHFVNVLKMAMDDQGFRIALLADVETALERRNLRNSLKMGEIDELKSIFESRNDQILFNNLECKYRGYQ